MATHESSPNMPAVLDPSRTNATPSTRPTRPCPPDPEALAFERALASDDSPDDFHARLAAIAARLEVQ